MHTSFIFDRYVFDKSTKTLELFYKIDSKVCFVEKYVFDFEFAVYDDMVLDRAFQILFMVAGISYYKTYIPKLVEVHPSIITEKLSKFLEETYQKGLGEFYYVNKLDPTTKTHFPANCYYSKPLKHSGQGLLVGIGGGKDSIVSVDLIKNSLPETKLSTWSLSHRKQLEPLVRKLGTRHYYVERILDPQLNNLNATDAYNGHIPISAIFACVGTVVAILSGHKDVVVSNEQSANEPTLTYRGVSINHQYSKSQDFERLFQAILRTNFDESVRYYSLLRPLSEMKIAELFAKHSFMTYRDVFSSCNRAFVQESPGLFWDTSCPKCCFVYLILFPFLGEKQLDAVFHKNLLLDNSLVKTYRGLLGIEGDKPLDCVGEIQESRMAMKLAQKSIPELYSMYEFDTQLNYDYRKLMQHEIPNEIWQSIQPLLA